MFVVRARLTQTVDHPQGADQYQLSRAGCVLQFVSAVALCALFFQSIANYMTLPDFIGMH